jgi:hypothetical protein
MLPLEKWNRRKLVFPSAGTHFSGLDGVVEITDSAIRKEE